ncbi:MAG TPA: hemerythrin domain-containing protein [Chloroflexia bacterium]|nr:hemerythrin domain-containing protein [Chloroflexia bacterium]
MTLNLAERKFVMGGYLDMHKAIRRQLDRIIEQAASVADVEAQAIEQLQSRFGFYWEIVEHHHITEDKGFFPMLAGTDALFAGQLARLTADHEEIDQQVLLITNSLTAARQSKDASLSELYFNQSLAAIRYFRELMLIHLEREEAAVMPAITRHFSEEQQVGMETHVMTNMGVEFVSKMFPWTFEVLDDQERAVAFNHLPEGFRVAYPEWEQAYNRGKLAL